MATSRPILSPRITAGGRKGAQPTREHRSPLLPPGAASSELTTPCQWRCGVSAFKTVLTVSDAAKSKKLASPRKVPAFRTIAEKPLASNSSRVFPIPQHAGSIADIRGAHKVVTGHQILPAKRPQAMRNGARVWPPGVLGKWLNSLPGKLASHFLSLSFFSFFCV